MAFEQYFMQGWESIPTPATESEKVASPCFDCSICLDFARDPVVTLCGHLYCWPCIYEWFNTSDDTPNPKCPVCKSQISQKTIVPLYGRGESSSESQGKVIPPRPSAIKGLTECQPHNLTNSVDSSSSAEIGGLTPMFGEMVYARVFGNSQSLFTYPNSYDGVVSSTPRLRRRYVEAHKSLNRVSIFLFCFCLLCLLVF